MRDDFLHELEYDPAAPDVEAIMRQIRRRLATQGQAGPDEPGLTERAWDARSLDDLRLAQAEARSVALSVAPSQTPVVGRLLDRVRLALHRLVVFYVGRQADAQGRFNGAVVTTLEGLAGPADREAATGRIARLEGQLAALEARLRALEGASENHTPENKRG